jgi:hypothetical protein
MNGNVSCRLGFPWSLLSFSLCRVSEWMLKSKVSSNIWEVELFLLKLTSETLGDRATSHINLASVLPGCD